MLAFPLPKLLAQFPDLLDQETGFLDVVLLQVFVPFFPRLLRVRLVVLDLDPLVALVFAFVVLLCELINTLNNKDLQQFNARNIFICSERLVLFSPANVEQYH